ncbi:glutamine--fructose-6-phosphate transaminase (isomerizing) [Candidatus Woesearchaeota archaeon]|jgi:glutamine---fructose-6-phosphate transaminase (isomerizing)|nr:glutamine--fructose-6-phosphate transaminase (isomerizing) [Candidatus Woesearchaeota archaeon]
MCGIIGYMGEEAALPIIIEGLQKLEYRGYDSFGFAIENDLHIQTQKFIGSITENKSLISNITGNTGIGHTRWATHGPVCKKNAHPHLSSNKKFIIVHNGIIENFEEIKSNLNKKGFEFYGDTDTEVIAKLIEEKYNQCQNVKQAIQQSLDLIKGAYAIAVVNEINPNNIFLACKDAPLKLGISDTGIYFASDPIGFLRHTNQVITLEDNDFVEINNKTYTITNNGEVIQRNINNIEWQQKTAEKNDFNHFMLKEIHEQSKNLKNVFQNSNTTINNIKQLLKNARRVLIIGCGTAYHAGLVLKNKLLSKGIIAESIIASEFEQYKTLTKDDVIVTFSQSGETADLLEVLKNIKKEKKCKVITITNVVQSTITRFSDEVIYLNQGPEIGVASTKAYTGMIAAIELLICENPLDFQTQIIKQQEIIAQIISKQKKQLKIISEKLVAAQDIYLIGRGKNLVTALEGALKIKEISYIHSEGMAAGELKHGTLALIEKGVPVIVIAPTDEKFAETISNALEIKSRGGKIIGISDKPNNAFDEFIEIPKTKFQEITTIIPLQMIAYNLAIKKGFNPDKPRNLAKSVTVK